jgi:pyruvate dehydrogenase E1 component beta subunit
VSVLEAKMDASGDSLEMTMGEAINRVLFDALSGEERVVILGQDIGHHGGTFGITRGLLDKFGDQVVRDGPLCESATVGFAIGLAITGVRAVVELEILDFIGLAVDQIYNQAAKIHYFSGGKLNVPLVIRAPIASGGGMGPQHSQSLEAWFMHIPGLRVVLPSNAAEAYGLLRTALQDPNPVLFLENGRLYGRRALVKIGGPGIPFGQARIARTGSDLTVVALSAMVDEALAAAEIADKHGISVEVVDPRTIAPLDIETIVKSVCKTSRVIVAHHAHRTGGAGAEIASQITEKAFDHLDAPVVRIGALDVPFPSGPLVSQVFPSRQTILDEIAKLMGRDDIK